MSSLIDLGALRKSAAGSPADPVVVTRRWLRAVEKELIAARREARPAPLTPDLDHDGYKRSVMGVEPYFPSANDMVVVRGVMGVGQ